jgi:hypothetical protein
MKNLRLPPWSWGTALGAAVLAIQLLSCGPVSGAGARLPGPPGRVRIAMTIDRWRSWVPAESAHVVDSLVVEVRKGEAFGPLLVGRVGKLVPPFRLLEILGRDRVRLRFDESLVVCGEGISNPSKQNPIALTTSPACFRTRSSDSGADYRLRLVR